MGRFVVEIDRPGVLRIISGSRAQLEEQLEAWGEGRHGGAFDALERGTGSVGFMKLNVPQDRRSGSYRMLFRSCRCRAGTCAASVVWER